MLNTNGNSLTKAAIRDIVFLLLTGQNYREVVIEIINTDFLRIAMDFLKRVATAKMGDKRIDGDWYKDNFLNERLEKSDIATNAGTNLKTITNAMQTGVKEVVLATSLKSYSRMVQTIDDLLTSANGNSGFNINLKIEDGEANVELELTETLIVINALATKRAAIRGGAWSTVGKRVEKPLMETLCHLFGVKSEYYSAVMKNQANAEGYEREVDFYLCPPSNNGAKKAKCEVKLMGRGNPESADAVIARGSRVFVADKLSDTNKKQLNSLNVLWVELHSDNRLAHFQAILEKLNIPHNQTELKNITEDDIRRSINSVIK